MRSLSAHLRRPEGHAELPFHPGCPVCRGERVAGVPYSEGVVSRRTRAALTAGVLALAAAGPTGALAAEPDNDSQGDAGTEQAGHGEGANSDPGGVAVDLPPEVSPAAPGAATAAPGDATAPPSDADDGGVALDQDPANVNDTPVIDLGDEPVAPSAEHQPSSPPSEPVAPAPAAQAPDLGRAAPTAVAALPSIEGNAQRHAQGVRAAAIRGTEGDAVARARHTAAPRHVPRGTARVVALPWHRSGDSSTGTTRTEYLSGGSPNVATQPEHPSGATASGTAQSGQTSGGSASAGRSAGAIEPTAAVAFAVGASEARKRAHVVRPGESLWSVAKEVLGAGASTAQIAREVNRLWELNKASIETGDPDLLMVGTRLRLR